MTNSIIMLLALILLLLYIWHLSASHKEAQQRDFIKSYQFHYRIAEKVQEKYPDLTPPQLLRVMDGLRDYFLFCQQAPKQMIAMPSQVVDIAWHEFILFTKNYDHFCDKAMGRFLHQYAHRSHDYTDIGKKWLKTCLEAGLRKRRH